MSDTGVIFTHVCGYCGTKVTSDVGADNYSKLAAHLPPGWVTDSYAAKLPDWFTDDGEAESPPRPQVYCSKRCRQKMMSGVTKIKDESYAEGLGLAHALYRERLRAFMLEARGAVTALGEIVDS